MIFSELAVTISAAVIFSSILALSLTPVMCSKFLSLKTTVNPFTKSWCTACSSSSRPLPAGAAPAFLAHSWLAVVITVGVVAGTGWLLTQVKQEYAPKEDQGAFFVRVRAPEGTVINRMIEYMDRLEVPLQQMREEGEIQRVVSRVPAFGSSTPNSGMFIVSMMPWMDRSISTQEAVDRAMADWRSVPSVRAFAFVRSGLSRGGGDRPVQFVLGRAQLRNAGSVAGPRHGARRESYPGLERVDSDFKETQPQVVVRVDKNRAADLGVSVETIGRTLGSHDERAAHHHLRAGWRGVRRDPAGAA